MMRTAVKAFCTLLLMLAASTASGASLRNAVALVQQGGLEFPGETSGPVSTQAYWRAAQQILETARANPDAVAPHAEVIASEIARLNGWDHYTELSGDYLITLVRALFELRDERYLDLLTRQAEYGRFVANGLSKFGVAAIDPTLSALRETFDERYGLGDSVLQDALVQIAERCLDSSSTLSSTEKSSLRQKLKEQAIPAMERAVEVQRQRLVQRGVHSDTEIARLAEKDRKYIREMQDIFAREDLGENTATTP